MRRDYKSQSPGISSHSQLKSIQRYLVTISEFDCSEFVLAEAAGDFLMYSRSGVYHFPVEQSVFLPSIPVFLPSIPALLMSIPVFLTGIPAQLPDHRLKPTIPWNRSDDENIR